MGVLKALGAVPVGRVGPRHAILWRLPDEVWARADALFLSRRDRLVGLVAHYGLPAVYPQREFVMVGGLMSYAASVADGYRQAGIYVGRVLRGAVPTDLPVVLPSKFDFFINLKTAKALGLTVPATLLAFADEVIE